MKQNADKAREAMRRWRQRHPAEHAEDSRSYYARHRERLAAYFAGYQRTHRELRVALSATRRARKLAGGGAFTAEEWLAARAASRGRCSYCGEVAPLEADHRVPLARGGGNTIDNIAPACPSCNRRKHAMTEDQFIARLRHEGRRVRPSLRRAACPQHVHDERGDQEDGKQA